MTHELERVEKLTSSSSPWVEKIKTEKIWLCESVGKLKGKVKQGKVKMNKINVHTIADEFRIHTISDLQLHVCHRGKVFLDLILAMTLALDMDLALGPGSGSGSVSGSGSGSGSVSGSG